MFEVKLPARINVLGNPSDANEGAHQTISAAINLYGRVEVGRATACAFGSRTRKRASRIRPRPPPGTTSTMAPAST